MAGTFLAMRLGKQYGNTVCLFDKDEKIGGRLTGVKTRPGDKNSPLISIGGRRLLKSQKVMMSLVKELNITIQEPEPAEQFCFARGQYHFTTDNTEKDKFANLYPGLPMNRSKPDYEYQLVKQLFDSPERKNIINHPNLRSYIESVIGGMGFHFLRDMTRFKADFTYSLSAKSYIDWLEKEYTYDYDAKYPIGGMSIFVKKMESKARKYGVVIFRPEVIYSINKQNHAGYLLRSSKRQIEADRVIIAAPPNDLTKIRGDIAEAILSEPPFKHIKGVRVMTITQWYKNPWWKNIRRSSNNKRVWRAWTSDSCIVAFEIPQEPYLTKENVFRVSYNDNLDCISHFNFLRRTNRTKLEEEIRDGLNHLLENNGITNRVNIPKPTKTVIKDWHGAWYWLESKSPFSNKYIETWATKPLVGEDVGLASDAYFLQRTGWSEAAILSSIHLLKRQYDMHEFKESEEDLENSEFDNEETVYHSNEKEGKETFQDWYDDWSG